MKIYQFLDLPIANKSNVRHRQPAIAQLLTAPRRDALFFPDFLSVRQTGLLAFHQVGVKRKSRFIGKKVKKVLYRKGKLVLGFNISCEYDFDLTSTRLINAISLLNNNINRYMVLADQQPNIIRKFKITASIIRYFLYR